jgi:hypothetical protein
MYFDLFHKTIKNHSTFRLEIEMTALVVCGERIYGE